MDIKIYGIASLAVFTTMHEAMLKKMEEHQSHIHSEVYEPDNFPRFNNSVYKIDRVPDEDAFPGSFTW